MFARASRPSEFGSLRTMACEESQPTGSSRLPATCLGLSQGFRAAEETQALMESKRPDPSRRRNNEKPDREISFHEVLEGANKHGNGHWKGRVSVAQN